MTQQIKMFCERPQRGITLSDMMSFGHASDQTQALLENAKMLHQELPVRLSRRINELQKMPYGLSEYPPLQKEKEFTALLEKILQRHSAVVPTIAQGILMLKDNMGDDAVRNCPFLQDFLDRFYLSRIGVRIFGEAVCPGKEAEVAVAHATQLCEHRYGCAPEVAITGDVNERIAYVPGHLHHMLHELLKNAMRAVVEKHVPIYHSSSLGVPVPQLDLAQELPDIELTIAAGESDFHIRISDQGGGIPGEQMAYIWNYMYTTAEKPAEADIDIRGGIRNAPMAGFGYGLPLSRLYARYFGGDLDVASIDGYGTNAYLYLSRLGNTKEPLPY
ncbi:hypothetical protein AAMO2058_000463000 [Amorphochlora amoebiformis]